MFLDEVGRWWRVQFELVRLILPVDRHIHSDRDRRFDVARLCIEQLTEIHCFDSSRSKRGTDGRRGRRFPCLDYQPD